MKNTEKRNNFKIVFFFISAKCRHVAGFPRSHHIPLNEIGYRTCRFPKLVNLWTQWYNMFSCILFNILTASNSSFNGKSGRSSPGKKVQRSQPGKGKSTGDSDLPSGQRGGGGGGSVSRPSPKDLNGPAFYIGGGNGVAL